MSTVRDVIKNLFEFNLDAEFEIIGNDGKPINITELNIGWDGVDSDENGCDVFTGKMKCSRVVLFPDAEREMDGDSE